MEDSITIMPKTNISALTKENGVHQKTPSIKTSDINQIFLIPPEEGEIKEENGEDSSLEDCHHTMFDPVLYQRGVPSDAFNLILSGKVMVQSGNEGFMIT